MALQVSFWLSAWRSHLCKLDTGSVMQFSGFDDIISSWIFQREKRIFYNFYFLSWPISSTLPKSNANYRQILQLTELLAHLAQWGKDGIRLHLGNRHIFQMCLPCQHQQADGSVFHAGSHICIQAVSSQGWLPSIFFNTDIIRVPG